MRPLGRIPLKVSFPNDILPGSEPPLDLRTTLREHRPRSKRYRKSSEERSRTQKVQSPQLHNQRAFSRDAVTLTLTKQAMEDGYLQPVRL
jgi:hypothetical protein